jgi:hypothetical protein
MLSQGNCAAEILHICCVWGEGELRGMVRGKKRGCDREGKREVERLRQRE